MVVGTNRRHVPLHLSGMNKLLRLTCSPTTIGMTSAMGAFLVQHLLIVKQTLPEWAFIVITVTIVLTAVIIMLVMPWGAAPKLKKKASPKTPDSKRASRASSPASSTKQDKKNQ